MIDSNVEVLKKIYSQWSEGNVGGVLSHCADTMTFQVPGKSPIAGKYTKANFESGLITKLKTLSEGTYKLEAHDLMSSSIHGTVLVSHSLTRNGKKVELRAVHVWRFADGKPIAWYEYPRDLYQFDEAWS